jgi:energy-coupling factor transporter ATP-binding protein EcfA2
MKITKLSTASYRKTGLGEFTMGRLGQVVLLTGRNGSGKTRLLDLINRWNSEDLDIEGLGPGVTRHKFLQGANVNWREKITLDSIGEKIRFAIAERNLKFNSSLIKKLENEMYECAFDSKSLPSVFSFIPRKTELTDPSEQGSAALVRSYNAITKTESAEVDRHVLPAIQSIQNRWWNATHPEISLPTDEKGEIIEEYDRLKRMIQDLAKIELDRTVDGELMLSGFPASLAKLSEGQRILLQFSVVLHAKGGSLDDSIILMDEPETRLHPQVLLEVVDRIVKSVPKGQVWIATHSVALLSHFDLDTIWLMEAGVARHAGSSPESVLASLLGNRESVARYGDFLGLSEALAANHFSFQCLLAPSVVGNRKEDRQIRQIANVLSGLAKGRLLKILDFGAGKGRCLAGIIEAYETIEEVRRKVSYFAFDKSNKDKIECERVLRSVYGDNIKRCYIGQHELDESRITGEIDVVLMCNVLHEIEPRYWEGLFSEDGIVTKQLNPSGFLLVVEDLEMRIGEGAHISGFHVLNTLDLFELFQVQESEKSLIFTAADPEGRLKAHLIPRSFLPRVFNGSVKRALVSVQESAKAKILVLRKRGGSPSYKDGKRHALWMSQIANAQIALDSFSESANRIG